MKLKKLFLDYIFPFIGLVLFFYLWAASIAWAINNPNCNSSSMFGNLGAFVQFESVPQCNLKGADHE